MADALEVRMGRVERTPDALHLTATVRNTGPTAVWLFDRLFRTERTGHYRLDDSLAYVEEQGGVLIISRKLHPVPQGLMVEFPEIPCVSRLAPGESREQYLRVPLPAKTWVPYAQGVRRTVSDFHGVRVQWGFIPDAEGLRFYRGRDVNGQEFQYPAYGPSLEAQRVVESGLLKP